MGRATPEIWFINLQRARERRALMEVQAASHGIALNRFAAVEAAGIDAAAFRRLSRQWERPMTRPELAAFLSHRALWEKAAERPEGLIVLEDDTVFSAHFAEAAGKAAAGGAELVNLESFGRRKFFRRGRIQTMGRFRLAELLRDKAGAGAYWLSPRGARLLLDRAESHAAPADAFIFGVCRPKSAQLEPAVTMQVHLLAARGFDVGLTTETSIQLPRQHLPLAPGNLGYIARRLGTQMRLGLVQMRRLADAEFRPALVDEEAFRAVLPISRKALDARLAAYAAEDQSVS
ncbi:glycosyltransferase family 25 protein [Aurantimonas sp. 22II-16-19i]|uniref:glycosyltransferase family 25 protein n=1 Tax=Aurantimonas sp. 22II-16-19i TaxID=1317114 RepID=UPI0009F7C2D7|nr:glycosyltransferase family 25 protein [Aurantimonas sp. 22II-16-19i]ORE94031.1 glycosyl transferase family protein [Aurantimonas sp. 22II-16-19i]